MIVFTSDSHPIHEVPLQSTESKLQRLRVGALLPKQILWATHCCHEFVESAVLPDEFHQEEL